MMALAVSAQGLRSVDIIHLHSGSVWKGTILSWETDGVVILETLNGTQIKIPEPTIRKVRQKVYSETYGARPYTFKETGLYHTVGVGLSKGEWAPGISATYAIGYRFNRWIGVGIGSGYENFEVDEGMKVIPVFAEARGFLTRTKVAPYYSVRAGYGFALKTVEWNISRAEGGFLFNPEVGVRFGGGAPVSFYTGMGIHLQRATYEYTWPFSEGSMTDTYLFKRWELKFGVVF